MRTPPDVGCGTHLHSNATDRSTNDGKTARTPRAQSLPPAGGDGAGAMYVLASDDGTPTRRGQNNNGDRRDDCRCCCGGGGGGGAVERLRTLSGLIVTDPRFKRTIVGLIIANAMCMGVATFDFVTDHPGRILAFEIADTTFLAIFTVEIGLQFLYHGSGLFTKGWLVFDATIILLSWAFASLQIFRAIRIFRSLRLVTRIDGLRGLVDAILNVFPKMFAVSLLILLVFYIYAVMFTEMFKGLYEEGLTSEDWFSRLDTTMFTLFQLMTLDDWSLITKEVMAVYEWAWLPIITFILFSSFIVVNLMIAVICDAVAMAEVEKVEEQMEHRIDLIGSKEHTDYMALEAKIDALTRTVQVLLENQKMLQQELRIRDTRLGAGEAKQAHHANEQNTLGSGR